MKILNLLAAAGLMSFTAGAATFSPEVVPAQQKTAAPDSSDMATQLRRMVREFKGNGPVVTPANAPARVISRAEGTNIYGGVLYADTWSANSHPYGIYTTTTTKPIQVNAHYLGEMFTVQGGGFYNEGKYYFINYEIRSFDNQEYVYTTLYECETMPFKNVATYSLNMSNIARDLTFDPIEQEVYGIFSVGNLEASYLIGRMALDGKYSVEKLVSLDEATNQVAIASDAKGNIYTIGADGNLYRLDKENKTLVKIGSTGVSNIEVQYPQSATIDLTSGIFYWAALKTDGSSALYTVNPATGRATKIDNFPDNEEFAGIYVPVLPDNGAPKAVPELFPTFEDGSLSGLVAFDAPSQNVGGGKLSGNLNYYMSVNGEEKFTGSVRAGKRNEEIEMTLPQNGWYTFSLVTENSAGRSIPKSLRLFIGHDQPVACPSPKASNSDRGGDVSLIWGKPREGVNGGYIDTLQLSYDVVRMPDNVKVASNLKDTVCTDKITETSLHTYYYVVTANFGQIKGVASASNKVAVGHIAQAPYTENFDTEVDFSTWTVAHLSNAPLSSQNGWGTWNYSGYKGGVAQSSPCDNVAKDDWLFSPPIHLSPERAYNLKYKAMSQGNSIVPSFIEHMEVKMGSAPNAAHMTMNLVEDGAINNPYGEYLEYEAVIHVAEEGEYHIGFHATTPGADLMWMLNIDDVTITPGLEAKGPARVTDFKVEALPKGVLGAVISFKAPERGIDNKALSSLDKVEILRDETVIKTFDKPAPGAALSYTDDKAAQGYNTYTVVAYADGYRGLTDKQKVFVGFDVPGEANDIVLRDVDGVPTVTWSKPDNVGRDGHYIDPDGVTYTVIRYFSAREQEVVADKTTEMSYVDTELSRPDQAPVAYIVKVNNSVGTSEGSYSNSIFVGDAFSKIPLIESFPRCASTSVLAYISRSDDAAWGVAENNSNPEVTPYDNDGGMAVFYPVSSATPPAEGYTAMLYSNRFELNGVIHPAVSFYIYKSLGSGNGMSLMVNSESNGWEEVEYISASGKPGDFGWKQVIVPLDRYIGKRYIQIGLRGVAKDASMVFIDNIVFDDMIDHNLELTSFSAPAIMELGQTAELKATVTNRGLIDATDYKVRFYNGNIIISEVAGTRLAPGMSTSVKHNFVATIDCTQLNPLQAEVVYAPDMKAADNRSEEIQMFLDLPRSAYVTDLEVEKVDGNARLTWSAPDASTAQPEPVCEGFDDYTSFIINNIGNWTLYDGDKQPTWGISSGVSGQILQYDHAGEAMAWQVFNPVKAGLSINYQPGDDKTGMTVPDWRPRSGSQMLISYAPRKGNSDDWLISPRLAGNVQLVKFYARSVLNAYSEQFEILVSTTDNRPESFTRVSGQTVGMTWTPAAFVLPEEATYFAIRCTSPNSFALLLDDISYAPEGAEFAKSNFKGYNVYVDGTLVTPSPISSPAYSVPVDDNWHRYGVTAVYDNGESRMSNIVTLGSAGLDEIIADDNADGEVEYFNLQGIRVSGDKLVPGFYIRRTAKGNTKVYLR